MRKIVFFGSDFWEFYDEQTPQVKERIDWTLGIVRDLDVIPEKYFKHIAETSLYEVRVSSGNNIFRIFCFLDKGKLVVLLNAFQKKTQKTPKQEIKRALKLQKQYYDEKEN